MSSFVQKEHADEIEQLTRKQGNDRTRLLDFAEKEIQFMNQINALKARCDELEAKNAAIVSERAEAVDAYDKEREYFSRTENNLRITIQRLKEAIRDMKSQMEEMTSDEEKKLAQREHKLLEKEARLARQLAEIDANRPTEKSTNSIQVEANQGPLVLQLQKALEEVHVLREERQSLLERCNRLSHELRSTSAAPSCGKTDKLEKVEKLQYDLTKQQLALATDLTLIWLQVFL